ncbi:hypothetical protein E2C01_033186 [Portunus trituberculatus]|uniref:Uncharacterized protein n=1 Tax=Portunus trituberculatus TaxID=210409 RepID=A0A5B7EXY7_PORTR|nr:hypothetical protein [Portunus trituberculatus]
MLGVSPRWSWRIAKLKANLSELSVKGEKSQSWW